MNYWIIASDGNCYGPADDTTMRRWIAEGRVIGPTPVGSNKDGPWTEARAIPALAAFFPPSADASDQASAAAARSSSSVGAPPTQGDAAFSAAASAPWPPTILGISMLVSGIFNLLCGVAWCFTCFGMVWGVALLLLGIFELIAYGQGRTMKGEDFLGRAKTMAILDICTILAGNVGSFVCGIISLTQLQDARMRLAQRQS